MPVVTLQDMGYISRPPSQFSRQCPNMRTCWPGLYRSFSVNTSDRPVSLRRLAFVSTLVLNLMHITLEAFFVSSISAMPFAALNLIFFMFMAWNLHLIVEMQGERKVFSMVFGRSDFDTFLWIAVGVSALIVLLDWAPAVGLGLLNSRTLDGVVCLAVLGVAWVATWAPEGSSLV